MNEFILVYERVCCGVLAGPITTKELGAALVFLLMAKMIEDLKCVGLYRIPPTPSCSSRIKFRDMGTVGAVAAPFLPQMAKLLQDPKRVCLDRIPPKSSKEEFSFSTKVVRTPSQPKSWAQWAQWQHPSSRRWQSCFRIPNALVWTESHRSRVAEMINEVDADERGSQTAGIGVVIEYCKKCPKSETVWNPWIRRHGRCNGNSSTDAELAGFITLIHLIKRLTTQYHLDALSSPFPPWQE